jgi:hypothetical protein
MNRNANVGICWSRLNIRRRRVFSFMLEEEVVDVVVIILLFGCFPRRNNAHGTTSSHHSLNTPIITNSNNSSVTTDANADHKLLDMPYNLTCHERAMVSTYLRYIAPLPKISTLEKTWINIMAMQ